MAEFREKVMQFALPNAKERILFITALTEKDNVYRFNAAMTFGDRKKMKENAEKLVNNGVVAGILTQVVEGKIR